MRCKERMYQEPDSTCYMQPLLGPPAPQELFYQVNSYVKVAVQAALINDATNLHRAYVNIGIVLGINEASTNIVQRYFGNFNVAPQQGNGFKNNKTMFKKDPVNLEGMLANIDIEEKIFHIQQFIRRRRIPEYVIKTLHVPKRVDDNVFGETDQGMQEGQDSACQINEKSVKQDYACQVGEKSVNQRVTCQTVDKLMRLDVACQTQDDVMHLDVACQTPRLDVPCQSLAESARQDFSCQTMEMSDGTKALDDKLVRKDTDSRKRIGSYDESEALSTKRSLYYSNRTDSTNDSDATNRSTLQNVSIPTVGLTYSKHISRTSDAKSPHKDVYDRKRGGEVARVRKSETESRTSKTSESSAQRRESADHRVTKLVIRNLHPKVTDSDIDTMFNVYKSYKFSMVNYCSAGKSLGTAEVIFRKKADAIEAKNDFDSQKLDGLFINIVVAQSGSSK